MDISERTYLANNAKEGEKMISRDLLQQRNLRADFVFLEKNGLKKIQKFFVFETNFAVNLLLAPNCTYISCEFYPKF